MRGSENFSRKRAGGLPPAPCRLFHSDAFFCKGHQQAVHVGRDGDGFSRGLNGVGHVLEAVAGDHTDHRVIRGTPTAMESARVFSSMGSQGLFSAMARLMGQQPSAWAEISRGRRSMKPMAYRSFRPFQRPAMVQPSPTLMAI